MIASPCKDCPDRALNCHSSCGKYKGFQEKNNELLLRKSVENNTNLDLTEHRMLSKRRMRQNRGHFKNTIK
jgi:hypothetical protein